VQVFPPRIVKKVHTEAMGDWAPAIFDEKHIIECVNPHIKCMLIIEIQVEKRLPGKSYEPDMDARLKDDAFAYGH
jgi:hypothetical protein